MKMRRKNALRDFLKAFLSCLADGRNRRQPFHEAAVLLLNAICSVLTNLLNKRHGVNRIPRFEEQHWFDSINHELEWTVFNLQHLVSNLIDVNNGSLVGLRISLSSFWISASISTSSASESPSSAAPVVWSTPYNFKAYWYPVNTEPQNMVGL